MTAMRSPRGPGGGGAAGAGPTTVVPDRPVPLRSPSRWVDRHRFLAFVVLAYAISWSLWLVAAVGGGRVPFLLGALGPMAAAAIVTVWSGRSLAAWIRPVWRWRVPVRWWLYALGLPTALYAVVTLVLRLLGEPVNWSLATDRLPAYLSGFVFVLFVGGALEEPGGRGFGLPVLVVALTRGRLGQRDAVPSVFATTSG